MLYRDHRGGLDESLATTIEVSSLNELAILNPMFSDLKCEHYGYDERIPWDTYIITGETQGVRSVLGFSNGELI